MFKSSTLVKKKLNVGSLFPSHSAYFMPNIYRQKSMFLDEQKESLVYENAKEEKYSDILKQYYPCYICLTFLANAFSAIILGCF